jgi:aryl-alcohol dehydrogenase-like predicted oxidoreductase
MHHVDRHAVGRDSADLRRWKVIYVGSSNFAGWHLAQASEAARRRGSLGLASEQSLYNLRARMVEPGGSRRGLRHRGDPCPLGRVARRALRKVTDGARGAEGSSRRDRASSRPGRALRERRGAGRRGAGLAAAAAGGHGTDHRTSHRGQFHGSLRALEITLDQEALDRLDSIFPGPGGSAPEAYAW